MKDKPQTFQTPVFPVKGRPDTLSAEPIQELVILKYNKNDVSFESPAKGMHDCDDCTHYDPNMFGGSCYLVKGRIGPEDWCNKWRSRKNEIGERYEENNEEKQENGY